MRSSRWFGPTRRPRRRFLQDGVDGASQRQIARDARTSLGMIYYYFPTKNDLFAAVAEHIYAHVLQDITRALADDVPPDARLRRLFDRLASLSDEELDVIRIVLREVLVSSERRHRIVGMFARGHVPLLLKTLVEGMQAGAFRTFDQPMIAMAHVIALGAVPQVVRRLLVAEFGEPATFPRAEAVASAGFDTLMHGLGAAPRIPRSNRTRMRHQPIVAR
jgi:AcrR family transcriptional regulator